MSGNSTKGIRPLEPLGSDFDPIQPGFQSDPMLHVQRVFVYFLQNLFRDFPEGCGMRWRPEQEDSEIIITAEKPTLDTVGKLPHIVCVLGSGRWANMALDQFRESRVSDGRRIHTDLIPMTIAYHCMAKEGVVARRIAWYASLYTNVFRRVIMRGGQLHQVSPAHEFSAESGPSAYTGPTAEVEIIAVVVTVPFYWQAQWRITKPAELWRNLKMEFELQKANVPYRGHALPPRPLMVKGHPATSSPIDRPPAFVQEMQLSIDKKKEE
jgi:hypothetical protein